MASHENDPERVVLENKPDLVNDLKQVDFKIDPQLEKDPAPCLELPFADDMINNHVLSGWELYGFAKYSKKWLLNREEFEASTEWKNCIKNLNNIQVNGKLCLHEYTDATKSKYRYTLFSSNMEAENSVHLVQIRPQKRKNPESREEISESFFKIINESIRLLNNAKKTRRLTEAQAQALTDLAVEILETGRRG